MKKTLLAIALAAATVPLTFAAGQASTTPNSNASQTATTKTKKHVKKTHKSKKAAAPATK